jgi:hypothetical protein
MNSGYVPIKRRERPKISGFHLEKTTSNLEIIPVLRVLLNLCRRPTIRFGLRQDPRGRFRDPRFASFMRDTNRGRVDSDRHDAVLRGRKFMKTIFKLALFGGGAWVVLESAKALSTF